MTSFQDISSAPPGMYWARYKDHGWIAIKLWDDPATGRNACEVSGLPIDAGYYGKYIDLRPITPPKD